MAFYGYARLVDELGDGYEGDRLAALGWVEEEARRALHDPAGCHPLVARAASAIRTLDVDADPLFRLIEANRLDQSVRAYPTFEDLVGYCALSANPIGHLVLAAFGCADPPRLKLADSICTGLQLVEHWQDVREDAAAGRVYLPAEDLARFGVDPSTLIGPGPARPELRALMVFEVARARQWLDAGRPLIHSLPGRARLAVAGFWAGGQAALDAIEGARFDVLSRPSRPRPVRVLRHLASGLRGASR
jgi:squalene synthase HpnC